MGQIANRQLQVFGKRGSFSQIIPEFYVERKNYTNEHQSRDSNRSATNAGSMSTNFCVLEGDLTANER